MSAKATGFRRGVNGIEIVVGTKYPNVLGTRYASSIILTDELAEQLVAFLTDTPPDTTLDTAMRLLRDTKSLHIARELTQADHDVLRLAKNWGRNDAT